MELLLNHNQPIFEQIYQQIISYIQLGVLDVDEKLPSVRELASSLNVNPNTIARSYTLLEQDGYIYSMQKKGYFVARREQKENVNETILRESIQKIKNLGVSKDEAEQLIKELMEEIYHD